MISIKITKHYNVLIDDEFEYLQCYNWTVYRKRSIFYAMRRAYGKYFNWNMSWDVAGRPEKGFVVDHINGEGLDNRRSNLRIITQRQNCQNKHTKSTSHYPGVRRKEDKWVATIGLNGVPTHLGTYSSELEAFNAYKAMNKSLGFPEVIMPFTEEPPIDYSKVTRYEYFHMLQLMKQDGLSDREIEENLKGVEIAE